MRQASKVALLRRLGGGKFGFYSYDFFRPPPEGVVGWQSLHLRYVWSRRKRVNSVGEIFTDQSRFRGRRFTVGTNPWSHHVLGYRIPEEEGGGTATEKYRDYWGYEIDLLDAVSHALEFNYTIGKYSY